MTCKELKDVVEEYGTVVELVKVICTDRACTLDVIQKNLVSQDVEINEEALLAVVAQIKEMMSFGKEHTYDIGDAVTYRHYWKGIIYKGEIIGNSIVRVDYKMFYLYNDKRFEDEAFREHIFSKLEFEELGRTDANNFGKLLEALKDLNIDKAKWKNYVFVDTKNNVHCVTWSLGHSTTENLGKLIRRTSSK